MTATMTANPTEVDSDLQMETTTMSDPQRAAVKIAANLASGSVPRETSRASLTADLGVQKTRRRRGRSAESRALAAQLQEDQ